MKEAIAHINHKDPSKVHLLEEHLISVANQSQVFASKFNHGSWGYLLGLWHDLGKYSSDFQKYIRGQKIDDKEKQHAITGALYALEWLKKEGLSSKHIKYKELRTLLLHGIAGHHGGLKDWNDDLDDRINKMHGRQFIAKLEPRSKIPQSIIDPVIDGPGFPSDKQNTSLLARMLFSCLIDADRLDTEEFMNPETFLMRKNPASWNLENLKVKFYEFLTNKLKKLKDPENELNKIRAKILANCRSFALEKPGCFALTVPTGGGKTLSSMAFALDHAVKHNKDRIIYVIPYTSIIEQNAQVFREAFGELGDCVLEHHSNFDPKLSGDQEELNQTDKSYLYRLTSQNWNAPIVVTTNVQFFESLFSNHPSKCRKLHNVANSVIVFDEAHLFPVDYHNPITDYLNQLVEFYGSTLVLCSATPPWLSNKSNNNEESDYYSKRELKNLIEINKDLSTTHEILNKRISLIIHENLKSEKQDNWLEIVKEIENRPESILCIVNLKKSALELYESLPKSDHNYHLSTNMCAAHRTKKLAEIRSKLKSEEKEKIIVISTQLVEAGVDLDFPVVYRAASGLDSIAQAGGRCNREGLLELGELFVFNTPKGHDSPRGHLEQCEKAFQAMRRHFKGDLLSLEAFEEYFLELFHRKRQDDKDTFDSCEIMNDLDHYAFKTASENFKLIEDNTEAVIVPYCEEGEGLIEEIETLDKPSFDFIKRAQRFTVNIYRSDFEELKRQGAICSRFDDFFYYLPSRQANTNIVYDEHVGLRINGDYSAEDLCK